MSYSLDLRQKVITYLENGAHGAGLGNIVFCHPGTKVIEFFAPNHVHIPYWAIANQLGLDYYYLMGEGKGTPEYVESERPWADISINLDSLSEIMKIAGIN
ncbi:MAG: DUF563 domain-containing protein [Hormoscilla sp. GM7CHS1pb]|nr:DUF563 domain-containing protein [Hormoscilla sp. GM7CHS1pb]MBC6481971.1 DUF563 domain-containing protein [Hormoscilla sp. GM7CHS1pb]